MAYRAICLLIVFPTASSFPIISVPAVPASTLTSRGSLGNRLSLLQIISKRPISSSTRIYNSSYGKGSEIWPVCNEEPIALSASFPSGVIPQPAKDLLESATAISPPPTSSSHTDTTAVDALSESSTRPPLKGGKRRAIRRTLSHLLKSAAAASSRRARSAATIEDEYGQTFGVPPPAISKGPAILALALLGTNCVELRHIAAVIAMSAYFVGLASWCAAPKQASTSHLQIVNMPSLPAKGHVPTLITNPLGASLTSSSGYRTWLRVGALLGLLLPTVVLTQLTLGSRFPAALANMDWVNTAGVSIKEAKRIVGGPMFLLCCQALSEAVARAALLPLPMRILIPVSYNTLRLSSLQSWAFPSAGSVLPKSLQVLGIANLFYWFANLFLFLIPVGVIRYLRAHFFCVEATEVTVRKGGEDSVGLMP